MALLIATSNVGTSGVCAGKIAPQRGPVVGFAAAVISNRIEWLADSDPSAVFERLAFGALAAPILAHPSRNASKVGRAQRLPHCLDGSATGSPRSSRSKLVHVDDAGLHRRLDPALWRGFACVPWRGRQSGG